jgi:hypothetical protein
MPIAKMINEINATPVTPYVSNPSAVGPTLSPALSPVQSAITPGFLGSSSQILKTIFIKSEPISAIFVKIPHAILNALAESDSPIAKPIKHAPALSLGINNKMTSIMISSTQISNTPILIPDFKGIFTTCRGLDLKEAKAVRELASVLILTPNHATAYDPKTPSTDQPRIKNTLGRAR